MFNGELNVIASGDSVRIGVTPVPESGTTLGEFEALLVSERLPLTLPAAAGAKLTLKVPVWLAVSVKGRVGPVKLKPLPVTAA